MSAKLSHKKFKVLLKIHWERTVKVKQILSQKYLYKKCPTKKFTLPQNSPRRKFVKLMKNAENEMTKNIT